MALQADGTVWTWGLNHQVQLGDGTQVNWQVPRQVPDLPTITQISARVGHVLALASDGTVWAWGAHSSPDPAAAAAGTRITALDRAGRRRWR